MTERYTHTAEPHLIEAVESLPALMPAASPLRLVDSTSKKRKAS